LRQDLRMSVHPGDRVGRRVRRDVIGYAVRRDHDRGVGLVDGVGDGGVADVVVVPGAVGERPVVGCVGAGIGMCGVTAL
jgi:hypothetical protein